MLYEALAVFWAILKYFLEPEKFTQKEFTQVSVVLRNASQRYFFAQLVTVTLCGYSTSSFVTM